MAEFSIAAEGMDARNVRVYTDHAKCLIAFSADGERMSISSIFVSNLMRRRGIAQSMLQKAQEIAIERRALRITAAITSRESLDVFTKVFGVESLQVEQIGLYEDDITETSGMEQYTSARLDFVMSDAASLATQACPDH